MIVCLYEDRPTDLEGMMLAILSIARHCPGLRIAVTCPAASDAFRAFCAAQPHVTLDENREWIGQGFNVKPLILARLLEREEEVIWLDNDVIVNGDFRKWITPVNAGPATSGSASAEPEKRVSTEQRVRSSDFSLSEAPSHPHAAGASSPRHVVVTQDPWSYAYGGEERCRAWNLEFGRSLPGPINTCFLRFTRAHLSLLARWRSLTQRPDYLAAQALPVYARPVHMLSDQDVLTALLASKEFASLPLRIIRNGTEIIQHHGAGAYTAAQRLRHVFRGFPPLVHAMGVKPWRLDEVPSPRDRKAYYTAVYVELSPYVWLARPYRAQLNHPAWMRTRTTAARLCKIMGFPHPALPGLPQALLHQLLFASGILNFDRKRAHERAADSR